MGAEFVVRDLLGHRIQEFKNHVVRRQIGVAKVGFVQSAPNGVDRMNLQALRQTRLVADQSSQLGPKGIRQDMRKRGE